MKEYMKKVTCIIGILICSMNMIGCNTGKNEFEDKYIEGQDQQFMFCGNSGKQMITKSDTGYYFVVGDYLYYVDSEGDEAIVMCNKPNCLHTEETNGYKVPDCNALFRRIDFITYQDGHLYIVYQKIGKQKFELAEISLDGTSRKTVYEFDRAPTGIAIHRGKLYYSSSVFNNEGKNAYSLQMIDLNKNNLESKVIYKGELPRGSIQHIKCYGKHIYFKEVTIEDEHMRVRAFHYDIKEGKSQRIFSENDKQIAGHPCTIYNKVYYDIYEYKKEESDNISNFESDLENKNPQPSFKLPLYTHKMTDGTYIYAIDNTIDSPKKKEDKGVSIYSTYGERVAEYSLSCKIGGYEVWPGDEKYMFLLYENDEYVEWRVVDKSKLLQGENSVKTILKIDQDKLHPSMMFKR